MLCHSKLSAGHSFPHLRARSDMHCTGFPVRAYIAAGYINCMIQLGKVPSRIYWSLHDCMMNFKTALLVFFAAAVSAASAVCICCNGNRDECPAVATENNCAVTLLIYQRHSDNVDFTFCLKKGNRYICNTLVTMPMTLYEWPTDGGVCASRDVPACSKSATDCYSFDQDAKNMVDKHFPDIFGKVCMEPSGDQCVRTNVEYSTCKDSFSKSYACMPVHVISCATLLHAVEKEDICIPLKGGEKNCADRKFILYACMHIIT